MAFTKKRLTPVVNLVADPLFNFSNPFIQNGVIAGQYYTNEQTSYGLPKPSYLQITENSNTVTVVATAAEPLKLIFAYGIHDANTGGQIGAWRTFTAGVISNTALVATASNTSWVYAEVNENGEPSNPNVWTIDMGIEHSVGRTYTTSNVRPPAPQNGDVWFDFANNTLERYDSSIPSWQIKRRVYLGEVSKGGDDYLYSVQTWFPDRAWAEYQDQYYPPYYENPWRHFDGVSFTTNGEYISSQADSWKANDTIVQAVTGNKVAMNAIANNAVGQQLVGNSNLFLNYAANSTVALSSIANSAIASNLTHQLLANTYIALSNNVVVNSIASFTNSITGPILATGGNTVTDIVEGDTIYRVHTFTGSGTFTVHSVGTEANTIEYLIVAGGGGGAGDGHHGGGGAGGYLEGRQYPVSIGSYPVVVGAGGLGVERTALAPTGPTGPVSFPNPINVIYYKGRSGGNSSFGVLEAMGGGGGSSDSDSLFWANTVGPTFPAGNPTKDYNPILRNQSDTGNYFFGGSGGGAGHTTSGQDPWVAVGNGVIGQGHSGGGYKRTPFEHFNGVLRNNGPFFRTPQAPGSPTQYGVSFANPTNIPWAPTGFNPVQEARFMHLGGHGTSFNGTFGYGHGGGGGGGAGGDGQFLGSYNGAYGPKRNPNASGDGGRGRYSRITGTLVGYAGGGGGGGYWESQAGFPSPTNPGPGIPPTVMNKSIADSPTGGNTGVGTEGGGTCIHAPGSTSLNPTLTFIKSGSGQANRGGGGASGGHASWGPFGNNPTATYPTVGPVWFHPGGYSQGGNGGSGIVVIRYPIAKNADRWNKPQKLDVQYLLVGGGGGAGSNHSGGGGAGGFITNVPGAQNGGGRPLEPAFTAIEGVVYPVVVGAGGVGNIDSNARTRSTNGNDSRFAELIAYGGGYTSEGYSGWQGVAGSGGGSVNTGYNETKHYGPVYPLAPPQGHHGTPGPSYGPGHYHGRNSRNRSIGVQGYPGGIAAANLGIVLGPSPAAWTTQADGSTSPAPGVHAGAGGGGAGGAGETVPSDNAASRIGDGGAGLASPISGTPVVYAGGGGGGWHVGTFVAPGFPPASPASPIVKRGVAHPGGGGGGDGAYHQPGPLFGVIAQAGQANRGGGGGGGCGQPSSNWGNTPTSGLNSPAIDAPTSPLLYYGRYGGNGGSGIVVLRIPREYSAVFSPGCTVANSASVAGFFVYSVTATSTTSETVKFVRNT